MFVPDTDIDALLASPSTIIRESFFTYSEIDLSILGVPSISAAEIAKPEPNLVNEVLEPVTTTSSIEPPESVTSILDVCDTFKKRSESISGLYPALVTLITYGPPGLKLATEKVPSALETTDFEDPVGVCVICIVAPETFTSPRIEDVVSLAA